jgi:outer membrane usher protein
MVTAAFAAQEGGEPESSLRLRVRYSIEGAVQSDRGAVLQQTEYLSGRVRTGFATPWGEFVQSGVSQYDSTLRGTTYWRDEVFWRFQEPDSGVTYQAGDLTAGTSLGWVRSYDLTGLQIRRRYGRAAADTVEALTPDPALLRNMDPRVWSWDALPQLPDEAMGKVLDRGASEFSAQSGYVRLGRNTPTARYAPDPAVSGGVRYGLSSNLTIETYVEAGRRLRNGGAGLAGRFGPFGSLGLAATVSDFEGRRGYQWTAVHRGDVGPLGYFAGIQRRTPDYYDLGRAALYELDGASGASYDQLETVGVQWPLQHSALRMNYLRLVSPHSAPDVSLVNIAYSAALGQQAWWYTSAYADLADDSGFGLYLGFRMALGGSPASATPGAMRPVVAGGVPVRRRASTVLSGTGRLDSRQGVTVDTSLNQSYAEERLW